MFRLDAVALQQFGFEQPKSQDIRCLFAHHEVISSFVRHRILFEIIFEIVFVFLDIEQQLVLQNAEGVVFTITNNAQHEVFGFDAHVVQSHRLFSAVRKYLLQFVRIG